ncbi:MAG: hypothetical protein PWQ91_847 [Eubacteriales bacterium]|nr:hypothetical protein [Eubacteriales bacterium]
MKKSGRKMAGFLVGILLLFSFPLPVRGEGEPQITAEAAVLMDADTGRILYARNPHRPLHPASTTKIMTVLLALELAHPEEVVTVSPEAGGDYEGQAIGLRAGDRLLLWDLLQAAMVYSANDSTVAIGEHIAGSEAEFARLMTAKALSLGATNTNFVNSNGYTDPTHLTTAADLALITRYAVNSNSLFCRLAATKEAKIRWLNRNKTVTLANTNRLLHRYSWIKGVKTGSTPMAGNCLVAYACRHGRRLITVVLNSGDRYADTMALLEYGWKESGR